MVWRWVMKMETVLMPSLTMLLCFWVMQKRYALSNSTNSDEKPMSASVDTHFGPHSTQAVGESAATTKSLNLLNARHE